MPCPDRIYVIESLGDCSRRSPVNMYEAPLSSFIADLLATLILIDAETSSRHDGHTAEVASWLRCAASLHNVVQQGTVQVAGAPVICPMYPNIGPSNHGLTANK